MLLMLLVLMLAKSFRHGLAFWLKYMSGDVVRLLLIPEL
jgi:hypothetical protein